MYGGLLFMLVAIAITLFLVRQQQDIRSRASTSQVQFEFNPATASVSENQIIDTQIILKTGPSGYDISGYDITLNFPSNILELVNFQTSNAFSTELKKTIDNNSGTLSVSSVNIAPAVNTGDVSIGTAKFRVKTTTGEANIGITNAQIVASRQPNYLTTDLTQIATYTVLASNTPTETIESPTPTNAPIATLTPTITPSATPTPTTAINAPTPTPTTLITPTPTTRATVIGDSTGKGCVDITDFSAWLTAFQTHTPIAGTQVDFNEDGSVTILDFAVWLTSFRDPTKKCQ